MQISLLLFGIAKDIVGQRTLELDVEEGCSVAALKQLVVDRYPQFEALKYLGIAVNNEYADNALTIQQGDEIALIPPVSGG